MKLIAVLFFCLIFSGCRTIRPPGHIPDGKVAVFIGQDNATIHAYVAATGHVPAGFMTYTSIQDMDGVDDWSIDRGSGKFNATELIEKYPGTALQIGLYMVDALKGTYQGQYDHNIDKLAVWMKEIEVPVFLRVGYEFDGPHNHYGPRDYKKAYIYIVDKLKAAGVTNAVYVWHSFASTGGVDISEYYPGDDYADWAGISYFAQPQDLMQPMVDFAREKGKPVMIGEATPQGRKTSHGHLVWAGWYQPLFRFVEANDIKIISYINSNWDIMPMYAGQNWGDARIEEDEYIKKAWLDKVGEGNNW
ncbi:MAG: hypothetical protein KAS66_07225 [Candidatus Omnitrophica bacterium]|nr:hypothetical protein [Candidatus Omnitrophota bacterium]